ncbi:transposase [Xenorhabdus beddingii]|uniref:Transposase n=1 Tax=Xenorhabdus beddingii TaxID=40578 RepID=A0A1Y2SLR9_9GAMM|nr:transposase [Xenorhabdus beddingii]
MRKSRISQYKQKHLQELFVAEATARTAAAELVGVNKRRQLTIFTASESLSLITSMNTPCLRVRSR